MGHDCAELLARERRSWGLLRLDRIDLESAWPEALWASRARLAPSRPRRTDVLPFVAFGEGGFEEYLATRSRNFRSQLGRRRRKLEREHGLSFRLTAGPRPARRRLRQLPGAARGTLERARRLLLRRAEDVQLFQRRFAAAALERGWLRLWIAEADGAPPPAGTDGGSAAATATRSPASTGATRTSRWARC